jgi:hypothetical protein
MKGPLAEGLLPQVLRDLYVGRKTGFLHFTREEERRSVYFRKGDIVHAETNVKDERLGETLVAQGLLSAADLKRATGFVLRDKKRLGEVLVELGILERDKLEDVVAIHVREILLKVLGWAEGQYEFEEKEEPGLPANFALKLSTGEMILEAARRINDPDIIRYALGDIDRILGLSNDPLLRFQKITLTPADGYVLSRVDGTMSAREILQLIPMVPEDTMRSLFGLVCTGVLEFLPVPPKAAPKPDAKPLGRPSPGPAPVSAAPAPPVAPAAAAHTPAPQATHAAAPPPAPTPTPAAAPAAAAADPAREARRREILEASEGLKTKTHFEILGIPKASNEAHVKDAYFKLARRFHPDTHHDPSLADLADKIEAIFIRLGEAYEVLRNPRSRSSYENDLASRTPRVQSAGGTPGAPEPPPAADPAYEARLAEESIRMAEKLFTQEKYWDAIQLIEPALRNAEKKVGLRARVLLAKAYFKNPKWVKRAEEQLQAVIKEEPNHVEAHFVLAGVYKASGLRARALHEFQRVLELKPDHESAAAEVAGLLPEGGTEDPKPSGGLLKKLFGKS